MSVQPQIRRCPNCAGERPANELFCGAEFQGATCNWDLTQVPLTTQEDVEELPQQVVLTCINGHPAVPGDFICGTCGADVVLPNAPSVPTTQDVVLGANFGGWTAETLIGETQSHHRYLAGRSEGGRAVVTIYKSGCEPDISILETLRRQPLDHVPEILAVGRWNDRAYDVGEYFPAGSLAAHLQSTSCDQDLIRNIAHELGRALASFSDIGLRHRNLCPDTIVLRTTTPLDLVVTEFGSARFSDFDLDVVSPLELTRYSAPETIVGGVSATSDWWSVGMILLDAVTQGRCFEGINEKAFLIHVVTRGVSIPTDLDANIRSLLAGLLTRDPVRRWQWPEVSDWLAGRSPQAPVPDEDDTAAGSGPAITLAAKPYARWTDFGLAGAEAGNWNEAKDLFLRGSIGSWLEEARAPRDMLALLRRAQTLDAVQEDLRLGLALMVLNANLPLIVRGEILSPAWLLANPEEGFSVVTGDAAEFLQQIDREVWIVQLRDRIKRMQEKARVLEIEIDEDSFKVVCLSTSRANLEIEWATKRRMFPDTTHAGLSSLISRRRLTDEDIILLVCASPSQFDSADPIVEKAADLARAAKIAQFRPEYARKLLEQPRNELFRLIAERSEGFARCGNTTVDEWADTFRLEKRLTIPRALALLAVPREDWAEPPRQQYVQKILQFFEKRAANVAQRGPLSRLLIGKTTARLDLKELGGRNTTAEAVLQRLIERTGVPISITPDVFSDETTTEVRLRRLVSHSTTYKRDTGIDGLYLGYPFLVFQQYEGGQPSKLPRIAPLLLWPIKISMQLGARGVVSVEFDKEREEVRLNPALDGLLGLDQAEKWRDALRNVLEQATPTPRTIIEAFSHLGTPTEFKLRGLPNKDYRPGANTREIVCAAALLHAEFSGQAVAEDLRALQGRPPAGTALETALRVSGQDPIEPEITDAPEHERYFTIDSDPSQETAVLKARLAPGVLVEGPPGTGKSQTIVNIISDCIGRGETVLVVCQKLPALQVVAKRLRAEKLQDRFLLVNNVNSDRRATLQVLRSQASEVRANQATIADLKARRGELAEKLDEVQVDLDQFHLALHERGTSGRSSYRDILEALIEVESKGVYIDLPMLRPMLLNMSEAQVGRVREQCIALAPLWYEAKFENSALTETKPFSADDALARLFAKTFLDLMSVEKARDEVNEATPHAFALEEIDAHKRWREAHEALLGVLDASQRRDLKNWYHRFQTTTNDVASTGQQVLEDLEELCINIDAAEADNHIASLFTPINKLDESALHKLLRDTGRVLKPKSFFSILNISRRLALTRVMKFLQENGGTYSDEPFEALQKCLRLEQYLRPLRSKLKSNGNALGVDLSTVNAAPVHQLKTTAHDLKSRLSLVRGLSQAVQACPKRELAERVVTDASQIALEGFVLAYDQSFSRYSAHEASLEVLGRVREWMSEEWINERSKAMGAFKSNSNALKRIADALPTLQKYQEYRARSASVQNETRVILAFVRSVEEWLSAVPYDHLGETVGRIIRREMLLSWKSAAETEKPQLLSRRDEIQRKIKNLAMWDTDLRKLNQELLGTNVDGADIAKQQHWHALTLLHGPNARRLREVFANGTELGLLKLRPVWLMVPEVASQLLPLKPGLFDAVVFDEASQMPIEHALPTLYRGKRVIVSGDEKQMPPSSFFLSKIESDEDSVEDLDELEETATENERLEHFDNWNRREIKDYRDLLSLSRSVLPRSMLEIHYRSRYRQLIAFSNAAYYEGKLHIPVQHSISESKAARPIEVHHVGGQYVNQVNRKEALTVVDQIAKIWANPAGQRPSLGVVTFNRKQADLIDDLIEERAEHDAAFRHAWQIESERQNDGEDVGFFVKNVENVQGDEREVIVFSSTFGRDASGNFRRSFGVLSQSGGERRLNVAITRAKRKIILITSLPVGEISDMLATGHAPNKARDYLQGYFDFATKVDSGAFDAAEACISRIQGRPITKVAAAENIKGIATSIAEFLKTEGIKVVSADRDDMFGLDLAIEDPKSRRFVLGIECDAPIHGMLKKARYREVWRPKMLALAIPQIHRMSSRAWYEDAERERKRLKAAVKSALEDAS